MELEDINQNIRNVELRKDKISSFSNYPFCMSAIRNLKELKLHPKVTFIDTEHYQIMRAFINDTQKMLDVLME